MRRGWLVVTGVGIGTLVALLVVAGFTGRYSVVGCETRVVLDAPSPDTTPLGDPQLERLRAALERRRRQIQDTLWDFTPGERWRLAQKIVEGTATEKDFPPLPPTRRERWCTVLDRLTGGVTARRTT